MKKINMAGILLTAAGVFLSGITAWGWFYESMTLKDSILPIPQPVLQVMVTSDADEEIVMSQKTMDLEAGHTYEFTLEAGNMGVTACDILIGTQKFVLASGLGDTEDAETEVTFSVEVLGTQDQAEIVGRQNELQELEEDELEEDTELIDDVNSDAEEGDYDPGKAEAGMVRIAFYPKRGEMKSRFLRLSNLAERKIREGDVILIGIKATDSNAEKATPSNAVGKDGE